MGLTYFIPSNKYNNDIYKLADRLTLVRALTDDEIKSVFQKCYNIRRMTLCVEVVTNSLVSLLTDYCPRLKSIRVSFPLEYSGSGYSVEAMTSFFQTFGPKVEELICSDVSDKTSILNWCPNLKRLSLLEYGIYLIDKHTIPKLNELGAIFILSFGMNNFLGSPYKNFVEFLDEYENSMKKTAIGFLESNISDSTSDQLPHLKSIEYLLLHYKPYFLKLYPLIECQELNMAYFKHNHSHQMTPTKQVTCPEQSNLANCRPISLNLLDNALKLAPNVKKLTIIYLNSDSNEHLKAFSAIKYLKRLKITSDSVNDSTIIKLLDNCKKLKHLEFHIRFRLPEITVKRVKELAIERPKQKISVYIESSRRFPSVIRVVRNRIIDGNK